MSWTPRTALTRAIEVAREQGPHSLWFKVWGELGYRRLGLFELPLSAARPELPARLPLSMGTLGYLGASSLRRDFSRLAPGAAPPGRS